MFYFFLKYPPLVFPLLGWCHLVIRTYRTGFTPARHCCNFERCDLMRGISQFDRQCCRSSIVSQQTPYILKESILEYSRCSELGHILLCALSYRNVAKEMKSEGLNVFSCINVWPGIKALNLSVKSRYVYTNVVVVLKLVNNIVF